MGALGTIGFSGGLVKVLTGQENFNLVLQIAGLAFSLLMLVAGILVIAYRAKMEIDLASRVVTTHQRSLGFGRSTQYALEEFDHIEIMRVRSSHSAPVAYSMVCLNGPNRHPNLLVRSEHREAAVNLAKELSAVLGLPVRDGASQPNSGG